ncbi:DNA invertase Pin-like site-specific DNA recombinase [Corynebacterium mucifaciens]|uniref:recombinase family protein n=1 Tax=Corynebacterium ureicelerivorans TaxID=401472 RepID=UPI002653FE18|nr:recombinase family protein [Corynebacterium ureicelerivorans]MDN8606265.1 recombinase family protein [Corynebacterium ureicelerivorans]
MSNRTEPSLPLDINEHQDVVLGQKVGYARVSSVEQNLDRQLDQLLAAGRPRFTRRTSAARSGTAPQLEEVLRYLRKGDQLIVTSMDRLARSLVDLHTIVEDLVGRGVSVRFLREGQTYSAKADPIAKLMPGPMGSAAEFERSTIKESQAEGIARAKERGVYMGRAKVLTDAQVVQARGWVADGVPKAEVARRLGIGRTTLYEYLAGGAA